MQKFCMSPSQDETLPELCNATREQLSINFAHRFSIFLIFLDSLYINSPVDQVRSICMHNQSFI